MISINPDTTRQLKKDLRVESYADGDIEFDDELVDYSTHLSIDQCRELRNFLDKHIKAFNERAKQRRFNK